MHNKDLILYNIMRMYIFHLLLNNTEAHKVGRYKKTSCNVFVDLFNYKRYCTQFFVWEATNYALTENAHIKLYLSQRSFKIRYLPNFWASVIIKHIKILVLEREFGSYLFYNFRNTVHPSTIFLYLLIIKLN